MKETERKQKDAERQVDRGRASESPKVSVGSRRATADPTRCSPSQFLIKNPSFIGSWKTQCFSHLDLDLL